MRLMALDAGWLHTAAVPARAAFHAFAGGRREGTGIACGRASRHARTTERVSGLREDHHVLVQSGDQKIERYALVNVEADRIVNSLNTLREQVMERCARRERGVAGP